MLQVVLSRTINWTPLGTSDTNHVNLIVLPVPLILNKPINIAGCFVGNCHLFSPACFAPKERFGVFEEVEGGAMGWGSCTQAIKLTVNTINLNSNY